MENKKPLLVITVDDIGIVPKVVYKGEEISNKTRITFDWKTADSKGKYAPHILIESVKFNNDCIDVNIIQHNKKPDDCEYRIISELYN